VEGTPVSRRTFVVGAAATALLAACGGESGSSTGEAAVTAGEGAPAGTWTLAQRFPQDVQEPGVQRLPISLAEADGRLIQDGPSTLDAVVTDAEGTPLGDRLTATRRDVEPGPYYDFRVPIDTPGFYYLVVDGGPTEGAAFQVMEPGTVPVAGPGDELTPLDTPTVDDGRGVDPVCTRQPEPCPFHDVTLTEALASERGVVYLIGTPAFCQTGTCAPALEAIIELSADYADSFTFVHAEVFTDTTAVTPTEAVDVAGLQFEPSLFVTDRRGVVVERLDAVWDRTELAEVLDRAASA
jgi:hypothetical protein